MRQPDRRVPKDQGDFVEFAESLDPDRNIAKVEELLKLRKAQRLSREGNLRCAGLPIARAQGRVGTGLFSAVTPDGEVVTCVRMEEHMEQVRFWAQEADEAKKVAREWEGLWNSQRNHLWAMGIAAAIGWLGFITTVVWR